MVGVWGFSQAETPHPSIDHCPPPPSTVPAGRAHKRRSVLLVERAPYTHLSEGAGMLQTFILSDVREIIEYKILRRIGFVRIV